MKLLRCAIYTRKSTEEGLEQAFNWLDAQREACEAYIKSQIAEGWVALPTQYDDGGFSGGNMERPALKALLSDIDRGLVDIVVVYKVDRLTRALADFAKIVERFDKRNVSFVSVTQAFNTTSSMGRLMLNVLLSFAQFEREVTSERIRDKLAASRKKGMWMGGRPPFGYAVVDKKLVPHDTEAPILRRMFTRYLELKSVHSLRDELKAEGVVSKAWVSRHGRANGGVPFDRGALYHMLQNRLYVGEILHKGELYKGQHQGIVSRPLFDKVQALRAAGLRREKGKVAANARYPLAGLLFDDRGHRMSPSHGRSMTGSAYRYYVSQALIGGDRATAGSRPRIPAEPLEQLVADRVFRLLNLRAPEPTQSDADMGEALRAVIERVNLGTTHVTLHMRRSQLTLEIDRRAKGDMRRRKPVSVADLRACLESGDQFIVDEDRLELTIPAPLPRRGGIASIKRPPGEPVRKAKRTSALLKAMARSHVWLDLLLSGRARTLNEVARIAGVEERYVRTLMPLAFLPPAMAARVFDWTQPANLTVDAVASISLGLSWS